MYVAAVCSCLDTKKYWFNWWIVRGRVGFCFLILSWACKNCAICLAYVGKVTVAVLKAIPCDLQLWFCLQPEVHREKPMSKGEADDRIYGKSGRLCNTSHYVIYCLEFSFKSQKSWHKLALFTGPWLCYMLVSVPQFPGCWERPGEALPMLWW